MNALFFSKTWKFCLFPEGSEIEWFAGPECCSVSATMEDIGCSVQSLGRGKAIRGPEGSLCPRPTIHLGHGPGASVRGISSPNGSIDAMRGPYDGSGRCQCRVPFVPVDPQFFWFRASFGSFSPTGSSSAGALGRSPGFPPMRLVWFAIVAVVRQ